MIGRGKQPVAGVLHGGLKRVALLALLALVLILGLSTSAVAADPPVISSVSPNFGTTGGGTEVTITGSGFTAGSTVTFGGVPATLVTYHPSSTLVATTPVHSAGIVDVVVTEGGLDSTTGTGAFTYVAPPTVTDVAPSEGSASGGTNVTIAGTSFATATKVTFGGVEGTINSITDMQITATTPAHAAGIVDVIVTNKGGSSPNTEDDNFKYRGIPTITGLSPNYGPVAGGTEVTITGTGFVTIPASTSVTFGDVAATSVTTVSDTQIKATTPAHAVGTVRVKVTTSYGETVDSIADDFSYIDGTRYEQSNSKITQAGKWSYSSVPYASGGSYIHTSQPGAAVVATFTGTSVKVIAKKCPWYGKALIKVDGGSAEEVDLYSSAWYGNWLETVYSKTGLAYGLHTITIQCMGEKSINAWSTTISVDALDITGTLTQAPSIKKIDDKDASCVYDANWSRWDNSGYWAAYLDTYAFSDKENAEMTFTFDGTFASWIAYTSMTKGKAEITLDPGTAGEKKTIIDLCTAGHQWKNNVYSTGILADGTHKLVIKCLREKSWWAWWYTVDADEFMILED